MVQSCPKDECGVSILTSPLGVGKHLVLEVELLVSFPSRIIQLQPTETALQTKPMCSKER